MGVIFDLDQTLIESQCAEPFRKARQWSAVYKMIPQLHPYEGITELLVELNNRRIPICIVTSSPTAYCSRVIAHLGWKIDALVCYHDTVRHKPYSDPIREGISRLNIKASEAVAVGDDANDIISAKSANVFSIGSLWGSIDKIALIESQPDILCKTVFDLQTILFSHFKA